MGTDCITQARQGSAGVEGIRRTLLQTGPRRLSICEMGFSTSVSFALQLLERTLRRRRPRKFLETLAACDTKSLAPETACQSIRQVKSIQVLLKKMSCPGDLAKRMGYESGLRFLRRSQEPLQRP